VFFWVTESYDSKMTEASPTVELSRSGHVGVIGLGVMGGPMAANLLANGRYQIAITGRTRARHLDLIAAGADWHDTPSSLAAAVEAIVLMLPDLPEVEAVLSGSQGILAGRGDDLLLIISSTSSPTGVRELATQLRRETNGAVRVVDAPVSGGQDGAVAGTLSIMVGGAAEDAVRAVEILKACGTPVHLGPLGSGQVAKACNQLIVAATILAIGEAAVLADRSQLDLTKLFALLGGGYAGSRILQTRGERIVFEDYSPSGAARYMIKDLDFATAIAAATDTYPALLPAIRNAFRELVEQGLGDFDIAVTRRFTEQRRMPEP
jgi:2-hydroxy-3-oxopropionate reductase